MLKLPPIKVAGPAGRPPSAQAVKSLKAQSRGLQSQSSPIYKTQSETSVTPPKIINDPAKTFNSVRRMSTTNGGMKPVKSLEDISNLLKTEAVKNVVVMAGAGISTPSGIPDFRTPGTGLYDNLQQYRIPYPEAIFDIDYFHHNPKPFFTLAKELYPSGKYRPNYTHYFIRMLYDKGMLLRMYTQNIDGLERLAGLPPDKLVEAHGTFSSATCTICGSRKEGVEVKDAIFKDRLPKCNKRGCPGIVKPDIVFFGEDLPQRFYLYLRDMLQTDLVIVMGTSLEVQPFAGIIDTVKYGVPRVLFNWNAVGPFRAGKRSQDIVASGDLIQSVQKFAEMTGWKTQMEELIVANEGEYIVCSPQYAKRAAERRQNPTPKPQPISNMAWRNRQDSSSSEESTESETESSEESSEEDTRYKHESFRRRGVRSTGSMKNNMGTAQIKNGGNRLFNDAKKNGINGNGQKRDMSTKVPNFRANIQNNNSQNKRVPGRNSALSTLPPSGRYGNNKTHSANPPSTNEKVKLAPISSRNNGDKNSSQDSNEKEKYVKENINGVERRNSIKRSEGKSPIIRNESKSSIFRTEDKKSINRPVQSSIVRTTEVNPSKSSRTSEISDKESEYNKNFKSKGSNSSEQQNLYDLRDNEVPSLVRPGEIIHHKEESEVATNIEEKSSTKNEKVLKTSNLSDTTGAHEHANNNPQINSDDIGKVSSPHDLASVENKVAGPSLKDNNKSENINSIVKDIVKSKRRETPLPSDLLLSTRSEPVFSNVRKLNPEISKPKPEKIKTVKSESALGANTKAESKTTSSKRSEKFKRSKSEKNLRKKEKEKKRSSSAKAKINLKLIHNRYAKNAKSAEPKVSNIGKDDGQENNKEEFTDQPYINLIGTLKREKPLHLNQNFSEMNYKEYDCDNNTDINLQDENCNCDNVQENNLSRQHSEQEDSLSRRLSGQEDSLSRRHSEQEDSLSRRLSNVSVESPLPDKDQMCSDADRTSGPRKKRLFKRPPKHKKKFDDTSKDLENSLNPLPYGYATPRYKRLTGRAVMPPNVCSGFDLPTDYYSSELLETLGPQKQVKLAYRHSLKSSSSVGAQVIIRESTSGQNDIEIIEKAC